MESGHEKVQLLPVLQTILRLTPQEIKTLQVAAIGKLHSTHTIIAQFYRRDKKLF